MKVALLSGGQDAPYARGLLHQLLARGVRVAFVGNDELADCRHLAPDLLEYHNLVGGQDSRAALLAKAWRILIYYARIVAFAARTDARLFHILWFRKLPLLERTLLNAYFRALGKKLVYTAHNVDDRARDGRAPTVANRFSLRFLYGIVDHVFVHTARMKRELVECFPIAADKVTIVPFGINDVIPASPVTRAVARQRLGFTATDKVVLFFGNIAPYKGLEDLVRACADLVQTDARYTLVLAGRPKNRQCEHYWREIEALIDELRLAGHVRKEVRYIPDEEVGFVFRASDVSVLPYRRVDQSGVLALSYAQGVPVIVADVGSLREDVAEGETGFVFRPGDVGHLADTLRRYFDSDLFRHLEVNGQAIVKYGVDRFSWATNADLTCAVYARVLEG